MTVERIARRSLVICSLLLLLSPVLHAQLFGGKNESAAPRVLTGTIFDRAEHPLPGAIVSLKNTRTLAVVTYIADQDGNYRFNNLSPEIDYEVSAQTSGHKTPTRTLSSFDTRKQAHINLKLEK